MAQDPSARTGTKHDAVDATSKQKLTPVVDFVAGTIAGIAGLIVGYPLDTVKVRFQSATTSSKYRSILHALATIVKEESVRGLFKGITSPMAACALMNGLVFASYGFLMRVQLAEPTDEPTLGQIALAGAGCGIVTSVVTCPSELIKIRQQLVLAAGRQPSAIRVASRIFRTSGIAGLFRGWGSTAWRDMGYGTYFATYEGACRLLKPAQPAASIDHASLTAEVEKDAQELSWPRLMAAGGVAGVTGWASTFAFDVVKTRVQSTSRSDAGPYKTTWSTIRHSYRAEGARVFFVGLWPTVVRAVPVNAVTFLAFELSAKVLSSL
ncbi:mitochondrial carrier [Exidia glandulosa HHB12029]|uniref:Mitochondrial carrier n=1 Tax=Exidia glandulosa HHB12029 TaxID=1314781 RepID=A0A165F210_EXIGL|nr:mitochondrial carrier [Exidia glandulosa HHB12029]